MIKFDNTYKKLPNNFYAEAKPSASLRPFLIAINSELASFLNIDLNLYSHEEITNIFSGVKIPEGAQPIALAYSGHQFGHFNPYMGDGRAILLGEVVAKDGQHYDLQLKGSGPTPFSKRGDGFSQLGPVLREYLLSEYMHKLNIPTTRALAACLTGRDVYRNILQPGGIFTRVAKSHLRVGTFEYFSARNLTEDTKTLCDYAINRLDPDLNNLADKYNIFFDRVCKRKMDLVARWMGIGFIHGVMNTDNTSISGETIDFGPCAFMDTFSFDQVFSSIDERGRYNYSNQANIALWNLSILANSLFSLLQKEGESREDMIKRLEEQFDSYTNYFDQQWLAVMASKIGISNPTTEDKNLIQEFLKYFQDDKIDFTNGFRDLNKLEISNKELENKWLRRLETENKSNDEIIKIMNSNNPYIIPRNHQVEKMIDLAINGDFSYFQKMLLATSNPYEESEHSEFLREPPFEREAGYKTFCGT